MYTSLAGLAAARYISLTTRRRDGSLVCTPVWVASDDGRRLLIWTGAATGKVKRIRRDPRVFVATSNFRGRERGPRLDGRARIIDDVDAKRLIRKKYGWQMRLLERFGGNGASVTVEVQDSPVPETTPGA
jgi:uncharacterized protein